MSKLRFVFIGSRGILRSGWRLVLLIVGLIVAGVAVNFVLPWLGAAEGTVNGKVLPVPLLVNSVVLLGTVFLVFWLLMRLFDDRSPATMGLPLTRPWLGGLGAGFGIGALPVCLTVAVVALAGGVEISPADADIRSVLTVTVPAILALFFVSSFEEVILRGYPMQLVAEGGGPWLAASLSAAVFALAHVSNPGANILGLVNTFGNGALLAWLVIRTGSLWIACGYHAGWNVCGSLVFGMRLSGIDVPGSILSTTLAGPEWITGGSYGFEGSTIAGIAEFVVLFGALIAAQHLPGHPELRRYFRRWTKDDPQAIETD